MDDKPGGVSGSCSSIEDDYKTVLIDCNKLVRTADVESKRTRTVRMKVSDTKRAAYYRIFACAERRWKLNVLVSDCRPSGRFHLLNHDEVFLLLGSDAVAENKVVPSNSRLGDSEKIAKELKAYEGICEVLEKVKDCWIQRPIDGQFEHTFLPFEGDVQRQVEKLLAVTMLRWTLENRWQCVMHYDGAKLVIVNKVLAMRRKLSMPPPFLIPP